MLYLSLEDFYETNWLLKSKLGFSIQEIENLYPYERELYLLLAKRDFDSKETKEEEL